MLAGTNKIELRPELFWDVDPAKIDLEKNSRYVIERILDFGHDDEARWMWRYYDHSLIRDTVNNSRALRAETRPLWSALLQIA